MSSTDGEHRLIAAGFGGQGVLTLGKLVCLAAMEEGHVVTYMPAYGSEVRGGTANCQVVVSSGSIYSPLVERADSLIVLNQLSYERFMPRLKPGGLVLVNSSGVEPEAVETDDDARLVALPAAEKAAEMGDVRVGNVMMLGAFVQAGGPVGETSCRRALEQVFAGAKADLLELNLEAFEAGLQAAGG
ncbi:MAG: 2-oxoacid:acceptor oxidoreductase family protein [Candidatus Brocadiia bacterium]